MEPLLIIGLGGVGSRIAQAARRRMLQDPALKPQVNTGIVQFLVFDTAQQCWAPDLSTRYEPLAYNFLASTAIETLRANSGFFSRAWPTNYRPGYLIREGGQVRLNGRLSYLHHVINQQPAFFMGALDNAYSAALNYWNAQQTGQSPNRTLTIAFCGSGSGGTCSGTLIDVAYAVKSYVENRGGIFPRVLAFMLDHEAVALHPDARQEPQRIMANHAALMLELEYWMNPTWGDKQSAEGMYDVTYPPGAFQVLEAKPAARSEPPLDLTFHICGTFRDGSVLPPGSYEPLVELAAEALYTMSRTNLANFATSASALQPGPNGMMQRHGSFGMISLRVPGEMILEHLSAGRAQRVLSLAIGDPAKAVEAAKKPAEKIVEELQLRERDADDVVNRLRQDRRDAVVNAPPDAEATIEAMTERTWEDDLNYWLRQYESWKLELQARAEAHLRDLAQTTAAELGRRLQGAVRASLADAVALCDALRGLLLLHETDLAKNNQKGIEILRRRLKRDGDLGEQKLELLRSEVRAGYGRFMKRGLKEAKEALSDFLRERMRAEEELILQEYAQRLFDRLLEDLERWGEACRWVRDRLDVTGRRLAGEVASGTDAGSGIPPLAPRLDFSAQPRGMSSALELHVLGSADVVDEVLGPAAWPEADDAKTLDERKGLFLGDANQGVVHLACEAKQAKDLAVRQQPAAWDALVARADSGELTRELGGAAKEAVRQGYEKFMSELTLDQALEMEAAFVVKHKERWPEILGHLGAEAMAAAFASGGADTARRKAMELRTSVLRTKAIIAAQKATHVPNLQGAPAVETHILSGNASLNPATWGLVAGQGAGFALDDRSGDETWRARVTLTYVAYGVELWWLASFHRALGAYQWWTTTRDPSGERFPVQTDARYGRDWPFELPPSDADLEAFAALFVLQAVGQIALQPSGHQVLLARGNREMDEPLGPGCAGALDRLMRDSGVRAKCLARKQELEAGIKAQAHPCSRLHALLDAALDVAKREAATAQGYARRRCERAWQHLVRYVDDFEMRTKATLAKEAEEIARSGYERSQLQPVPFRPRG